MLDDARKQKLMDLFAESVALAASEQAAFVDRTCADDPELHHELMELLGVPGHDVDAFLNAPAVALPEVATAPLPVIDGYTDLALIREGGMGTVYKAQQTSPIRRTVALKLIRPGMDSKQVLARFDAERQALARMAHPFIATVLGAGTDRTGRPFLAMEFVDGAPITDYCVARALGLEARLELFAKVCDGVDHAHRRGVLHRDLKPSNVLVVHDVTGPTPKVIDFGIAKALEGQLGEDSIHTLQGSLLGTPEYMSPEQLDGDGRRIDTRTDVYALGVVLYELLTGERPFDSSRLRAAGIAAFARIVREELPSRPSTRLRQRTATRIEATITQHWSRRLHSDLDWVVMKALEKEPDRRYASPRDLAADVRRFLAHQPVEASPPSGFYKLRRFARRYRLQLAALTAVVAALTVGLISTLWFLFESNANAADALAKAREAEGTRVAATAALLSRENPNLALLLAVEADRLTDDFSVHETILDSLPQQNLVGRFLHSDYGTTEAAFLADGRLLTCGVDPVFWLTDVDAQKLVRRFVGHSDRVFDFDVAPSQQLVATASADATARIWNLDDGACRAVLPHPGEVRTIRWSPDGRLVGTTCRDGIVRLFSASTFELQHAFGQGIEELAFDDSGERIVTQNETCTTTVWSTSGDSLRTIAPDPLLAPGSVFVDRKVFFAAGGTRIVCGTRRQDQPPVTLIYTSDGEPLAKLPNSGPLRTLGERLLLRVETGVAAVSLVTGKEIERFDLEVRTVFSIANDGRRAIVYDARENVCVADLTTGRITHSLSGENDKNWVNRCVAFHPDGERFAVSGRELLVWRFEAEYEPFDLPLPDGSRVLSLAAAAEALALLRESTAAGMTWSLWSIDQRRKLRDLPIPVLDELRLVTDGSHLLGYRIQPSGNDVGAQVVVSTFDLEGRTLTTVTLPIAGPPGSAFELRPEGGLFALQESSGTKRSLRIHDSRTGAKLGDWTFDHGWFRWGFGPEARFAASPKGGASWTEAFDLRTGQKIASIIGPAGVGHFAVTIDEQRQRMLIVLGDLRVRSYDLRHPDAGYTGEYTRLVRSNIYPSGVLPDGSLAWVLCANEVHLFDAVTCQPFAAIRLRNRAQLAAARADSSELLTITGDGRCQRWPLDAGAAARRMAKGQLTRRERDLYRIGTPDERVVHEDRRLADNDTSRSHAMRGELLLERGNLDEAIACYQRCGAIGPLAPMDLRRYLRLLELLARRHALPSRTADERNADIAMASTALREAVRCGVTRQALDDLAGFAAFARQEELRRLLPD